MSDGRERDAVDETVEVVDPHGALPDAATPGAPAQEGTEPETAEPATAEIESDAETVEPEAAEPATAEAETAEPEDAEPQAEVAGPERGADAEPLTVEPRESVEQAAAEPADPAAEARTESARVSGPDQAGGGAASPSASAGWRPRPWEVATVVMAPVPAAGTDGSTSAGPGDRAPAAPAAAPAPERLSTRGRSGAVADHRAADGPVTAPTTPVTPVAPVAAPPRTPSAGRSTENGSAEPSARSGAVRSGESTARATGSPMDDFPDESGSRRWPKVLGISAAVLIVLAGLYVGALWLWSDRVPPGATVAGVDIGAMPAAEARAVLTDQLAAASTEPVPVATADGRTTFDPVAAGLELDAAATVESVTGFGLEPVRLWDHLVGIGAVDPVTRTDEAMLETAVGDLAAALAVPAVDGTVLFVDGEPQSTPAVAGSTIDVEAATATLVDGWLTAPRPIELATEVTQPAITQDEVDRVMAEIARPLVAAPVSVAVADQIAELPPDVVASAASFVPQGDELDLRLAGEMLVEAVMARTTDLLSSPSAGSFAFENGAPVIVPGVPGTTLDPQTLADAVAVAGTGNDRTARVELVEVAPTESTEELQALGITQVVGEFATKLNSEPRRTVNIANGASKIHGTLIRPGETFSLTEALGPVDGAHGFVQAGAIVNGEHVDAWGGGLSQLSTTTYNAAYFAGFEDVEHHPHSEWFARYPEGREATIFTGTLDMQWKNNTPYGALVQAYVEGGWVHVKIWGTPYWTVETSTSGRSGIVAPTTVYSQSPTCEPQAAGNPGFSVTVTRRTLLDGVEQDVESWKVRYKPQNQVICGLPPGETPPTG